MLAVGDQADRTFHFLTQSDGGPEGEGIAGVVVDGEDDISADADEFLPKPDSGASSYDVNGLETMIERRFAEMEARLLKAVGQKVEQSISTMMKK